MALKVFANERLSNLIHTMHLFSQTQISPQLANQSCHGLLGCLCAELFGTEDFLFQLSVLELLIDLCESDHGHAYLREHGVLTKLDAMINTVSASPFASMLLPGFIKFFGKLTNFLWLHLF